jgi:DNA-binding winged helix-turn-helix (wHTH) protein
MNRPRQALGDSAESPRYIGTLARRGYRWMVPVEEAEDREAAIPGAPPSWTGSHAMGRLIGHEQL